jgi:hypothetical protein
MELLGRRRGGCDIPVVKVADGIDIARMHRVDSLPFPCEYGSAYGDDELLEDGEERGMSRSEHLPHFSFSGPDSTVLSVQDPNSRSSSSPTVLKDDMVIIHPDL